MSKRSVIERNKKRVRLFKKYKSKHDKLLKIANNNQLVWKKEFTDSNRKQLMKGHTCPNIYFRNWMRAQRQP